MYSHCRPPSGGTPCRNINVIYALLKSTFSGLQTTILSLTVQVYLHSFSRCCLPNLRNNVKFRKIRTYRSSRSFKVINFGANRKRICNFLLVINSNFGRIVPFSRYWRIKLENSLFSPPYHCLTPPLRGNPSEFLDETYPVKTRGMGLLYGENSMILTSTVFDWFTRVMDRRMDGRNCDSICALSICCRSQKWSQH